MAKPFPAVKDQALVQIVDSAFDDAAGRSGHWLLCRPGCSQCCIGVFAINQLDAARLQRGLSDLEAREPQHAAAVRERAREAIARLSRDFPGDRVTGLLTEGGGADKHFSSFGNDEPCPALDPETGNCELYEFRPMTCRVFGPPIRSEGGLGVCDLCYHGASHEEIASCEMNIDPDDLESDLVEEIENSSRVHGDTIIAFCLAS